MAFKILNKNRTTFINVELLTKKITIPSGTISGPHLDSEMSQELQLLIQKGEVLVLLEVDKKKQKLIDKSKNNKSIGDELNEL